jgi:cell shape-determining protein MreC
MPDVDHAIKAIIEYFSLTIDRMNNDEVLYTNPERYKSALADYYGNASQIKALIDGYKEQIEVAQKNERIAKSQLKHQNDSMQKLYDKNGLLMAEISYLREHYYMKETKTEIVRVPIRTEPRDAYDMPELCAITDNLLYRLRNDPQYDPDLTFKHQYKSKLKTTTHLDIQINN